MIKRLMFALALLTGLAIAQGGPFNSSVILLASNVSATQAVSAGFAKSAAAPMWMNGNIIITFFGVVGGTGCAPTLIFSGSTLNGTNGYASSSPAGQVPNNVINTWPVIYSAGVSGPFSSVAFSYACITYPTAGTMTVEFASTGAPPSIWANITTNTSTVIRGVTFQGQGFLYSIVVNAPGTAETITIYDSLTCTGLPIATVSTLAVGEVLSYNLNTYFGLCVTTTGTTSGNYTVVYR